MKKTLKMCLSIFASVIMLISCFGGIVASAASQIQVLAPAGQNLITDGDFENPKTTEWAYGEGVSITSTAKHTGNYGLEMKSMEYDTRANFEFSQIALAPNTTYTVKADIATNGTELSCNFNVTSGEADVERGQLPASWSNVTVLTIKTKSEYVFGKIAFEIYRGGNGTTAAYIDNVSMIATGNEWCPTPTGKMTIGKEIHEDFDSSTLKNGTLDKNVWLVSNTAWGGANGGLNSANVKLGKVDNKDVCILESHGDKYTGNVQGVGGMTNRVGAGIVTRDYYASARYTVNCKIEPKLGVCTAFWSFSYIGYMQDDKNGDGKADFYDDGDALWEYNKANNKDSNGWIQENGVRNSEIDWETPSPMDDSSENDVVSHDNLRTNCWGGKRPGEGGNYSGRSHQKNDATKSIADGNWHELVYEWFGLDNPYTDTVNDPAVIWFIDGVRVDGYDINNPKYAECDEWWRKDEQMGSFFKSNFLNGGIEVPRYGTRFWLATWFPVKESKLYCVGQSAYTGWAGTPDYDTAYTYLDYCYILPYTNGGTSYQGNKAVKPQYLGDDGKDLGDEYNMMETVPNKQFALPSEYPNYAASVGLLNTPEPKTEENGSTVTVTWDAVSSATAYDIIVDGKQTSNVSSPYVCKNLTIGNHTFKLRARNSSQTGIWSREALVSVGKPKNVQVTANGSQLTVKWDEVDGAVDYYMEIDNNPVIVNGSFVSFKNGDTNNGWLQGFVDKSIHHIRVKSVGPYGTSNWSGLQEIQIKTSGAPIPSLVLKNNDTNIHAFTAIIDRIGAEKYQLRNNTTGEIIDVGLDASGYPTKEFTGVAPGIYYYSARAMTKGVWSDWGTMQMVTVAPSEILESPGVHASAIDDSTVELYWSDVNHATSYDLEKDGKIINNVTSPYRDTNLTKGQTYKYRVRAINSSQTGSWSDYAYAVPGSSGGGGEEDPDERYKGNGTIKNGGFDEGNNHWSTDGNTKIENGKAIISGSDVDSVLVQDVYGMKANTTYTLGADITGDTQILDIYIRNADGAKTEINTNKQIPFTFTTGNIKESDGMTVIFSIYRKTAGTVTIDNVSLSEGTKVTTGTSQSSQTNPTQPSQTNPTNPTTPSTPSGVVYGDANEDGTVDMKDVLVTRKVIAHVDYTGKYNAKNADANADNNVDMKDILMMRKYIAHVITVLGPTI